MIPGLALLTLALAAAGWGAYEGVRHWRDRRTRTREAAQAAQDAENAHIRDNTTDFIQWSRNQSNREAARLERERDARAAAATAAAEDTAAIVKEFPDEKPPAMSFIIWIAILCGVWLIAALTQFVLDMPIVANINGSNPVIGFVVTLVFVSVPISASIFIKWLLSRRRAGTISPFAFRGAVAGALGFLIACVVIMASLAPQRAENEFADDIREAEQAIAMYREDGDETAVEFAEVELAHLEQQRAQSADFNMIAIPLTAALEFGTGFAVPTGYLIFTLIRARRREKQAAEAVTAATNAVDDHNARGLEDLSTRLMTAGVPQARIRQALAEIAAQGNPPAAPKPAPGGPAPSDAFPMPPAARKPDPGMVDPPATVPATAPDRTFDQS